jgi:outer membrane protein OmpA-like peptidoglycan-associated protein
MVLFSTQTSMRIFFSFLVLAGFMLPLGGMAQTLNATQTHDRVSGKVMFDNGQPGTGEIEFWNVTTGKSELKVTTAADGSYEVLLPKKSRFSFCFRSAPFLHYFVQPENELATSEDEILSNLELTFTVMQFGMGTALNLEGFVFEPHSIELSESQKTLLLQFADWLKAHPGIKVQCAGHANEEADEATNRALSRKRASACVTWLSTTGAIALERLLSFGYGSTRPLPGAEPLLDANRRTSFIIFENAQ